MPVIISLLRGVNLGPHRRLKMDELCAVYESLGVENVRSYVQSGNVLFRSGEGATAKLAARIETEIEKKFGFRPAVILRTTGDMRGVVAHNPFANRRGIEPNRLLVTFFAQQPSPATVEKVRALTSDPEEIHLRGREAYIYYPNGLGRPKVPWTTLEKLLQVVGTGRNWNSVSKLLQIAEEIE